MRTHLLPAVLLLLVHGDASAQTSPFTPPERPDPRTWYLTNGSEWVFSFPVLNVSRDSVPSGQGGIVRFAPFVNPRVLVHWDAGAHVGFFSGLGIRNLGFIYDVPRSNERYKYRTYTLGLPLGIKLGRMHKVLVFAGYELELPFNYKEKRYANEKKEDKFNVWFSDRTQPFFQSVMLGVQAPLGFNVTVKYTLTNFHNTDYREVVDGVERFPYAGLNANLVCLSVNWGMHAGRKRKRGSSPSTTPVQDPQARAR